MRRTTGKRAELGAVRSPTIASATHSCSRANHHPGGEMGTTEVSGQKQLVLPGIGRSNAAPPGAAPPCPPSPPIERMEGLLHLFHRGCLCICVRCCAAPAVGRALSVTVAAHAARGPWTTPESPLLRSQWVDRGGTRFKHSNTEPLLPAIPPQYHCLPCKLPSGQFCPFARQTYSATRARGLLTHP